MKNSFKNLIVFSLSIVVLYSCNSSDEPDQQVQETEFEDIANLKVDAKFKSFIGQLFSISEEIAYTDFELVDDLAGRIETLTPEEKLQLANALGFDTIEGSNQKQEELWDMWKDVVNRFGILYKDQEVIKPIFTDVLIETINAKSTTPITSKDDQQEFCENERLACMQIVFDRLREQTGADCLGDTSAIMCFPPPMPSRSTFTITFLRLRRCNWNHACCLIGYDSLECTRMS